MFVVAIACAPSCFLQAKICSTTIWQRVLLYCTANIARPVYRGLKQNACLSGSSERASERGGQPPHLAPSYLPVSVTWLCPASSQTCHITFVQSQGRREGGGWGGYSLIAITRVSRYTVPKKGDSTIVPTKDVGAD